MSKWASPLSTRIAVRQTPLTARLSPGAISFARVAWMRTRWPPAVVFTSTSVPTASTIPVNIGFDPDIRPARFDCDGHEGKRVEPLGPQPLDAARSDRVWRNDQMQPVDQ